MGIVPLRPFGELTPFRREMESLWKRFFGESLFPGSVSEEWRPSADISETKNKLLIKAELPGLEAKDINVSMSGDVLRNGDETISSTMHHSFRPPLPDLKSQKHQNSLLFLQLL